MNLAALSGALVQFRISTVGVEALAGIVEVADFDARVAGFNDQGAWIYSDQGALILLKWDYVATMIVSEVPPEAPETRRSSIGFSSR